MDDEILEKLRDALDLVENLKRENSQLKDVSENVFLFM
jgi:hypothetical protein